MQAIMKKSNPTLAKTCTEMKTEVMQLDSDICPVGRRVLHNSCHIFLSKLIQTFFKITQFTLLLPYCLTSYFNNYQKQGSFLSPEYSCLLCHSGCSYHPLIKAFLDSLSHLQALSGHWSHLPAYPEAKLMSAVALHWGKQQCNLAFLALNKLQAEANWPGRVAGNSGV